MYLVLRHVGGSRDSGTGCGREGKREGGGDGGGREGGEVRVG